MVLWRRGIVCLLSSFFVAGSAFAGTWQEKVAVPAEYQKIEYVENGGLFWLQKPKEKNPVQYFRINEGLKALPDGLERGGTSEDKGVINSNYAYDGYIKKWDISTDSGSSKGQAFSAGVDGFHRKNGDACGRI